MATASATTPAATTPNPFTWQELVRVVVYAGMMFLAARFGIPAAQVNVVPAEGQPAPVVTVGPR